MRALDVYLDRRPTGELRLRDNGQMAFQYADSWLERDDALPLSHSLPLRRESFRHRSCVPYFGGVLPEEPNRSAIARILGISVENDFALLEALGGECAGAVTLLPVGNPLGEPTGELQELGDDEFLNMLKDLSGRPLLAGTAGLRLSLAGAQDKVAVRIDRDRIFLPLGEAASTHIVKPAVPGYEGIVFNEAFCLRLAAASGLPAARCSIESAGTIDYLLVERFDRRQDTDGNVRRVHQEDFCQALGIRSHNKHESEGGPGLTECFELARAVSRTPVVDIATLLDAVMINLVIGNHDAHGKNFAWLRPSDGRVRLAPLYDLVSTAMYPQLSVRMAMRVGWERKSLRVGLADLERCAKAAALNAPLVKRRAVEFVHIVLDKIDDVEQTHPAFRRTAGLVRRRAEQFARRFGG